MPISGSIRVRSYGLYHDSHKEELALCRQLFGQLPVEEPGFLDWQTLCDQQGEKHPERCPVCGKCLIVLIGKPSLETIANILLRDNSEDVTIAAAFVIYKNNLTVTPPQKTIHSSAAKILKALGIIKHSSGRVCGIDYSFLRMVKIKAKVNWKRFFGNDYSNAEKQIICCRAYAETDITAWINAMDVFNDWLLISLYRNDSSLGTYMAGSIGSVMNSKHLRTKYPSIQTISSVRLTVE